MSRILVVDDAAFMRTLLRSILTKNGFEVVGEAENGHEAVKKYKALMPDLVTMDITMPGMDGIQAVKEIISIDVSAKIIMVSAMGQESLVKEAMRSGAMSFIIKPFNENFIISTLNKCLELTA